MIDPNDDERTDPGTPSTRAVLSELVATVQENTAAIVRLAEQVAALRGPHTCELREAILNVAKAKVQGNGGFLGAALDEDNR